MSKKELDVVGIGGCNLDMISFVPKFPEAEEKINAFDYVSPRATGVALDAITMSSNLGLDAGFIGKRGDDNLGEKFRKEVSEDDIDLSEEIVVSEGRTSLAWVLVKPDGERCHIMIPMGKDGYISTKEIDKRKEYIKKSRVCHMEILQMPLSPMIKAAEICKEENNLVSFDLDIAPKYIYDYEYSTPEQLKQMIEMVDVLKACENAVPDLTNKNNFKEAAKEILKMGPKIVIITLGEEGCVVAYKEGGRINSIKVPAFNNTEVKDTTGAGDAFQGGFIYGVLNDWPIKKTAVLANACGYLKSLNIGARNMPDFKTVKQFIESEGWSW